MFMNDPVQGFVGRGACISFSRRRWRAFPPHSSVPESRSLRRAYAVVPARWRLAGGRGGGFLCGAPSTWLHPRPAFLPMSCDSPRPPARLSSLGPTPAATASPSHHVLSSSIKAGFPKRGRGVCSHAPFTGLDIQTFQQTHTINLSRLGG